MSSKFVTLALACISVTRSNGVKPWDEVSPWQPATRCDRKANKLYTLPLISEGLLSFWGCGVESLAGQRHHYILARLGFTANEGRRGACWGWGTRLAPCQNFLQLCQEVMKPLWFVHNNPPPPRRPDVWTKNRHFQIQRFAFLRTIRPTGYVNAYGPISVATSNQALSDFDRILYMAFFLANYSSCYDDAYMYWRGRTRQKTVWSYSKHQLTYLK